MIGHLADGLEAPSSSIGPPSCRQDIEGQVSHGEAVADSHLVGLVEGSQPATLFCRTEHHLHAPAHSVSTQDLDGIESRSDIIAHQDFTLSSFGFGVTLLSIPHHQA